MHACIQWTCACVREGKGRGVQFRRKCEGASERKSLPSSGNCDWTGEMQRQSDDAPRVHWSEPVEAPSAQPLASISEESLLPQPWAKTVSSTSKSALSGLNTVSATTDSLLSLAQTGSGAVLSSAKGFVVGALESVASSTGFSVVEKTANTAINATNNLFNLAELLTFGTFHVASASTKLSLKAASETVNIFNSLFGSTESSRALTHLVHLVHQEILLHDPDFAQRGFIGNALGAVTLTGGITKALAAYACLQVMTHERTVESRRVARLLDAPVALNQAGLGSASAEAASAEKGEFFASCT
ncbi:hypothetical protein BC830DRAFT_408674 [Chytriomyces sp. MP71]|nr:hypothetical protein BC830DRAFT_408674 [Chytriomyces sp. MP71]